jgi:hypothetical protein
MQAAPAERSTRGYVDHVEGASHTRLLGETFAGHIVKAVAFVGASVPPPMGEVSAKPTEGGVPGR